MKANSSVKGLKAAMIITAIATVLIAVGVIINFVKTGLWSAEGCTAAAVSTVICSTVFTAYKKKK